MTVFATQLAATSTLTGSPEGVTTGNVGDVIIGTDGREWVKLTGTGNTGWGLVTVTPATQTPMDAQRHYAMGQPNTAAHSVMGLPALSTVGTATARAVVGTNALTRLGRVGYVSGAIAGNVSGTRVAQASFTVETTGFRTVVQFGISDATLQAVARMFVGWHTSTAAPTNVAPNSLLNLFGVGHDASATTLSIFHNDGTATANAIASAFPVALNEAYEATFERMPGATGITYRLRRLSTGAVESGTITTKLPAAGTTMTFNSWRTNNSAAAAVGLDLGYFGYETFL